MKYYYNNYVPQWNYAENSTQYSSSNYRDNGVNNDVRVQNYGRIRKRDKRKNRKQSFYSSTSSIAQSTCSLSAEDQGHYQFYQGQVLGDIYYVTKLLGQGTFGRVVQGEHNGRKYAIKIIRPVDRYIHSAKIEKEILKQINSKDKQDSQGIVRYVHSFYHRAHYCLAFRPLGKSLYDVVKLNGYRGFPMNMVQSFFKQILQSIGFLHRIGYTHTDLKPENILLQEQQLLMIEGFTSETKQIYLPKSDKIRIIDFGGATKYNEFHSSIICTRQYRPPEVILQCCKWNQIADVWSIGCIISELATGNLLFSTHNDHEHLLMIQKNSGKYPNWMSKKSEEFKQVFLNGRISRQRTEGYVANWRNLNNLQTIPEIFADCSKLVDLLQKCLEIDPNKRINCKKALEHEFFDIEYK